MSSRQRIVVLTFPDAEQAELWDDLGQPLNSLDLLGAEAAVELPED